MANLLIVLAVILTATTPTKTDSLRTIEFTGPNTLLTQEVCYDKISEYQIVLSCGRDELIHVSAGEISRDDDCGFGNNSVCHLDVSYSIAHNCEGKYWKCSTRLRNLEHCPFFNRVSVTFQCIDDSNVLDMCPSYTRIRRHDVPSFYMTPRFANYPLTYGTNTKCECTVSGENVDVEVLYLNLEQSFLSDTCLDYISFPGGAKYCNLTGRREQPVKKTLYPGKSWWFKSDGSITSRGGWLKLSSTNGNPFQITCTQNIPTTSWWTSTESQENEHSSKVGGIVGGVIGVVVGMIVVIIIVVVGSQKITRRPRPNRHVMTYHSQPRSCTQNDAPVSGSSTFSPDGQTDSNAPPRGRADPNAPPPDYSTLPPDVTAKGQIDIYPPPYTAGPL